MVTSTDGTTWMCGGGREGGGGGVRRGGGCVIEWRVQDQLETH